MWLTNSSIGRKVVMSVTGLALILFLTFHMAMNVVALFSAEAYNMVCGLLGANWYAVAATLGLAALFVIHIIYAFWLTLQNYKARGNDRYAVSSRPKGVEWSSQNMLVLGVVVVLGLCLHFVHFWSKMMLVELMGQHTVEVGARTVSPANGAYIIQYTFSQWYNVVLYIVWLAALWFHLNHGFWSALQTIGWNSKVWFKRWKTVSTVYTTIICLGFAAVLVGYAGNCLPAAQKAATVVVAAHGAESHHADKACCGESSCKDACAEEAKACKDACGDDKACKDACGEKKTECCGSHK